MWAHGNESLAFCVDLFLCALYKEMGIDRFRRRDYEKQKKDK